MDFMTHPIDQYLTQFGQVGKRLSEIGAAEGAAGNLSVCLRESLDVTARFPCMQIVELPVPAPGLAGATLIVTGSGRRLREIIEAPTANLACIIVEQEGRTGKMFSSPESQFKRVTSEFNSHLAVHHDRMRSRDIRFHAVLHAQPIHLTFLSHLAEYQDEQYLNRHLLRWQPETILTFPEGIGVLPFIVFGSTQLTIETMLALRDHRMVVWSQHGVMARSDDSLVHALDLIEYAEAAAQYEYLNLTTGGSSEGISAEHIRAVSEAWNVRQKLF